MQVLQRKISSKYLLADGPGPLTLCPFPVTPFYLKHNFKMEIKNIWGWFGTNLPLPVAEAEGAEEAMQTGLRERPTHLRQVQKQVPRGFHHRARPADFTLRLLWRESQEKGWPKVRQSGSGCMPGAVQARGEAQRDEVPRLAPSLASRSHPANSRTTYLGLFWTCRLRFA